MHELKDVIVCLTKELLKKDAALKHQEDIYNQLIQSRNQLSEYLYESKTDVHMLEQIVDKLNNKD